MRSKNWYKLLIRIIEWRYSRYYWLVIVLVSAAIATIAELWVTRLGPGASGDSVHYMQGATNLLAGNGFSRLKANGQLIPITSFPPGFSFILAGLSSLGIPVFVAGRYLNAILLGISTVLVGLLLHRTTRSGLFAILGSWLFMYAGNIVRIHSWIMSEPLFIFLSLLALLLLDLYLQRGKLAILILACLAIGFAGLTRYVGLALIPAVCLAILLFSRKKPAYRWRDAIITGLLSLAPVVIWFWHNAQVTGNPVNRQLIYHPISKNLIFAFFDELSYWWFAPSLGFPWRLRWALLGLFIIFGVGVYLYTFYKRRRTPADDQVSPIAGIASIYGFFYVIVLMLNTSFIDAATDESTIRRYAIPLIAVGIIWTFSTYSLIGRLGWSKKIIHIVLLIIGLGMTLFYASESVPFILHPGYAFGYTDILRNWTCEVDMLKTLDPQQVLITNDYELFYFLADRPAYQLAGKYDPSLGKSVEDSSSDIESVKSMLRNGAILAALGDPNAYSGDVNALIGDMGLKISEGCSHLRLYIIPVSP